MYFLTIVFLITLSMSAVSVMIAASIYIYKNKTMLRVMIDDLKRDPSVPQNESEVTSDTENSQ